MRYLFFTLLFLWSCSTPKHGIPLSNDPTTELRPCPSSPNCISTMEIKRQKRMEPLTFTSTPSVAINRLDSIVHTFPKVTLVSQTDQYIHYTFKTSLGGFIDDVEFLVDAATGTIHFRSASRVGWSDMGANKRRMKKITKNWKAITSPVK